MAASAAAAIGTSFSPSIRTLKCTRLKRYSDHSLLKHSPPRMINNSTNNISMLLAPLSRLCAIEPISLVAQPGWRLPSSVSAAVAQEEAAVTPAVEEEEGEKEVVAAEEGEGEPDQGSEINTKLYFGNLPYSVDSAQLAGIIQDYATPELVEVLYDRESGRSRGFAFVTMSSIEDCSAVIENLDGREFMGRALRVNISDKPKPKEPLYPETEHKLFVGNLSWSVTSESLAEAFKEHGNVVGARVIYDGESGKSRGYGFVCFSTRSEMETALEALNGVELEGRDMRVSLAQGRKS